MNFMDLRKYTIKNEDDALDFLELLELKIPQMRDYLKRAKTRRIALQNRVEFLRQQPVAAQPSAVVDETASVGDRLSGLHKAPEKTTEQNQLQKMRDAQPSSQPSSKPKKAMDKADEGLPEPMQPGEIGQLYVPDNARHVPSAPEQSADEPAADEQSAMFSYGGKTYVKQSAQDGSVSYQAGGEDIDETAYTAAWEQHQAPEPASPEDTEGIGQRVARKTKNGQSLTQE
jgi:hypothetical protein